MQQQSKVIRKGICCCCWSLLFLILGVIGIVCATTVGRLNDSLQYAKEVWSSEAVEVGCFVAPLDSQSTSCDRTCKNDVPEDVQAIEDLEHRLEAEMWGGETPEEEKCSKVGGSNPRIECPCTEVWDTPTTPPPDRIPIQIRLNETLWTNGADACTTVGLAEAGPSVDPESVKMWTHTPSWLKNLTVEVEMQCLYLAKSKHSQEGVQDILLVNARISDVMEHFAEYEDGLNGVNAVALIVVVAACCCCCCGCACSCKDIMKLHKEQSEASQAVEHGSIAPVVAPGQPYQPAAAPVQQPAHLQQVYGSPLSSY